MTMHAIGLTTLNNTAKDFRNDMSAAMFGATTARPTGGRSGTRYGTPTSTVSLVAFAGTIKPHSGFMDVQTSATAGPYWYAVTANETFTVSAAHATLPRVDIVTIRINDNVEDASGLETCTAHYKAGTAAASPVAPSPDTTREMIIATIAVPASGGGNPVASWVAPYAVAGGGIIPVRTTTERDALQTAYPGTTDAPLIVWRKDVAGFEYNDGTGWKTLGASSFSYDWANAAARTAQTGMLTGYKGYQRDTGVTYRYDGATWKAWESDWITYTTTLSASSGTFAVGTGGSASNVTKYRYKQGTVEVWFSFVLGTSGQSMGTTPKFTLPVASATPPHPYTLIAVAGDVFDTSATAIRFLPIVSENMSTTVVRMGYMDNISGLIEYPTATMPWTWAAGDALQGTFSYTPA